MLDCCHGLLSRGILDDHQDLVQIRCERWWLVVSSRFVSTTVSVHNVEVHLGRAQPKDHRPGRR